MFPIIFGNLSLTFENQAWYQEEIFTQNFIEIREDLFWFQSDPEKSD